jgi:hypothetical protein
MEDDSRLDCLDMDNSQQARDDSTPNCGNCFHQSECDDDMVRACGEMVLWGPIPPIL